MTHRYLIEDEHEEEEPRRRKSILLPLLIVVAVLLLVASVGMWGYTRLVPPVENAKPDIQGNWVVPDEIEPPEVIAQMAEEPEIEGKRFVVPSVGLDVPLGAVNAVNNTINPPGFKSVFRIRNMGASLDNPHEGTVYMATHSLRHGGMGPGNYLIDVEAGAGRVAIGADMFADKVKYRVVDVMKVEKTEISGAGIWDETVPNRIVVITCLQRPDNGSSVYNIVVVGELVEEP